MPDEEKKIGSNAFTEDMKKKHFCPWCLEEWECIYEKCIHLRNAICFVCFSKRWHEQERKK